MFHISVSHNYRAQWLLVTNYELPFWYLQVIYKKKNHTVVWYFISEQAFNASQEIHVDLKEFIMECSN